MLKQGKIETDYFLNMFFEILESKKEKRKSRKENTFRFFFVFLCF